MRRETSQYGQWWFGKPTFELHEVIEGIFRDVCKRIYPGNSEDVVKGWVAKFHLSLNTYRKQSCFFFFRVSSLCSL